MDNTPLYIKMSEKAEKIQKLRGVGLWQEGDWFTAYKHNRVVVYGGVGEDEPYENSNPIWLPTQAQLQEMIPYALIDLITGIWKFTHKKDGFAREDQDCFRSMEQLWLAFIMFELYQKTWNGEDWING